MNFYSISITIHPTLIPVRCHNYVLFTIYSEHSMTVNILQGCNCVKFNPSVKFNSLVKLIDRVITIQMVNNSSTRGDT